MSHSGKPVSELSLLQKIIRRENNDNVPLPNGDDAAVIKIGNELIAITTDTVVEGRHFTFSHYSPRQVGIKAVETAVSDLVAVGARPHAIVIALTLPEVLDEAVIQGMYAGVDSSCTRLDCVLLGGDITTGSSGLEAAVTAVGRVENETKILRRSGARSGDLIFVTGPLGGSQAGLRALQKGMPGCNIVKLRHLEPKCRLDLLEPLTGMAHAAIDISDGLSSEIHHICKASGCGAVLVAEKLPYEAEAGRVADELEESVLDYVLNGGEDYEILYTIDPANRAWAPGSEIGWITGGTEICLQVQGKTEALQFGGFDHFAR